MRRSVFVFLPLALLAGAIALLCYGATHLPAPKFDGDVRKLLPPAPSGWKLTEKPIAESPEMKEAVGELLNFDDGVLVDYIGPSNERLSVYIAYWTPGRMSHRLIATHTPDVCWVGGGWRKTTEQDTSSALPHLPTGEARTFEIAGTTEYVWYWHLVGEESKRYGTGFAPPWYAAITDMFEKGLNQREEQFFIRLSSSTPLESFQNTDILRDLMAAIPWPTRAAHN